MQDMGTEALLLLYEVMLLCLQLQIIPSLPAYHYVMSHCCISNFLHMDCLNI